MNTVGAAHRGGGARLTQILIDHDEESDPARRLVQLAAVARRPEKKREPEQPATTR